MQDTGVNRGGWQLLAEAQKAFAANNLQETERLCSEALSLQPNNPGVKFLLGNVAVRSGKLADAERLFQETLALDPNALPALEWLANVKRDLGKIDEAAPICLHLMETHPEFAGGFASLGLCYLARKQPNEAVGCFLAAVKRAPEVGAHHFNLGNALEQSGQIEPAIREYRAAITLDPTASHAYVSIALLLANNGRKQEAISYLKRLVDIAPSSLAYTLLADAYAEMGTPQEAIASLRKAIELDPSSAEAHEALGRRMQDEGLFEEAVEHFEKAIKIDPTRAGAYYGLTQARKFTVDDKPLIERMEAMALEDGRSEEERRQLYYGAAKGRNDLGGFGEAMALYDQGNAIANKIQLVRPFSEERLSHYYDQMIETFTPELYEELKDVGLDATFPLFIVGMIRSGTTLTEQILSSHPKIGAAGELSFWTDDPQTELIQALIAHKASKDALRECALRYRSLLRSYAPKATLITDKMPLNYNSLGLIHLLFPKAKIIHCRRNPIDNCISIYTTPYGAAPEFCYDKANIVTGYREYQRLMAHYRKVIPSDRMLEVDYEELVQDRERVVRKMIEFCGLEWDDACLRHEANERTVRTPSRWQARQPVYSSSVDRWKRYEPWLGEFRGLLEAHET